jgi:hypothetical protein
MKDYRKKYANSLIFISNILKIEFDQSPPTTVIAIITTANAATYPRIRALFILKITTTHIYFNFKNSQLLEHILFQ